MKIAFSAMQSEPSGPIDMRFGRAAYFLVYDEAADSWQPLENTQNLQAPQGAGIQSASTVVNAGCGAVVTGHCGPKAFRALSAANVAVYLAPEGTVAKALAAYREGRLKKADGADVEGHW